MCEVVGEEVAACLSKAYTEAEEGPRVDLLERKLRAQLAWRCNPRPRGQAEPGKRLPERCFDPPLASQCRALSLVYWVAPCKAQGAEASHSV